MGKVIEYYEESYWNHRENKKNWYVCISDEKSSTKERLQQIMCD